MTNYPEDNEINDLKLVEIEVEKSTNKISELYEKIVNSDFAEKLEEYWRLSQRQDAVLEKIRNRKAK